MSYRIKYEASQRGAVFAALYNSAKGQGMGTLHYIRKDLTAEHAAEFLWELMSSSMEGKGVYFDYCQGRVMKTHIGSDRTGDMGLYDRDNGEGAAWRAVAHLQGVEREVIAEGDS